MSGTCARTDRGAARLLLTTPTGQAHKGTGSAMSRPLVRTVTMAAALCTLTLPMLLAQQVAGGGTQPIDLAFEGTAAISGVVTDATTRQPLADVMVYLGFQGRGAVGRLSRQVSDEKGRFVFTDSYGQDRVGDELLVAGSTVLGGRLLPAGGGRRMRHSAGA